MCVCVCVRVCVCVSRGKHDISHTTNRTRHIAHDKSHICYRTRHIAHVDDAYGCQKSADDAYGRQPEMCSDKWFPTSFVNIGRTGWYEIVPWNGEEDGWSKNGSKNKKNRVRNKKI